MDYSGGVERETYRQVKNISLMVAIFAAVVVMVLYLFSYLNTVPVLGSYMESAYKSLSSNIPLLSAIGGASVLVYLLSSSLGGFPVTDLRMV